MNIWIADFNFETTLGGKGKPLIKVVEDVVTLRIPATHITRKTDFLERAMRGFSITELKTIAKDKQGRYKVKVIYKRIVGQSNERELD